MTLRQRIISVTDANINNKSLKFPNTSLHNRVQLWPTEYVACYFKTHYNTNSHHQSEWIKESNFIIYFQLFMNVHQKFLTMKEQETIATYCICSKKTFIKHKT